jgi:ankyrin repeat protein
MRFKIILAGVMVLIAVTSVPAQINDQRNLDFRLFDAARDDNLRDLKQLLQAGANINARNRGGNTPLLLAIRAGHSGIARALLAAGADVNISNVNNISALALAVYNSDVALAKQLIDKGARIEVLDNTGKTTMVYAAANGLTELVGLFMDRDKTITPDKTYSNDLTALMWAAGYGRTHTVEFLLGKGANPNLQDARGRTALMMAVTGGFPDTVKVLLPKTNPDLQDNTGKTALDLARASGHGEVTEALQPPR